MENLILYIVIAIAGIILGKLDTVFTNSLKRGREAKKEQVLQVEIERLKDEIERLRAQPAPAQPEPKSALRLAPHESGGWVVEIDGQPVRPETISAEQRARLISLLGQIRPLVEAKPVQMSAPAPSPAPTAAPARAPVPPPAPAPATPIARPAASAPSNLPPSPLRASLISAMSDTKASPPPGLVSVVSLIDNVLQKQIAGTPLASRQVRLEQGISGEVLVFVGTTRYAGIDSVPDPEIQAAIRRAIEEFNKGN
jgi:hypothetical protein